MSETTPEGEKLHGGAPLSTNSHGTVPDGEEPAPLVLQAALSASPLLFLGLPAWLLVIVLDLFDIDARWPVGLVMACVLPVAMFFFARLCAKYRLIRPDASPVALAILQTAAAYLYLWWLPQMPESWRSAGRVGTQQGGSLAGFLGFAIVAAAGYLALALFSRRRAADAEPMPLSDMPRVPTTPEREPPEVRARRLPP